MNYRRSGYWIAAAIFWGLTSAAVAGSAGIPPAEPVVQQAASAHRDVNRSTDRPQQHPHRAPTKHLVSAKPSSTQPGQPDGAASGQYQSGYANPGLPASLLPDVGVPRYLGQAAEGPALAQDPTHKAAPATPASQGGTTVPDDNWSFKASPLVNATHSHEIGATVSFRHDF
ncbi:hypothetical protein [Paraburkholderia humisilvae]|nr:hypothetical protein [Paraburkholderia humisilvae]